MVHEDGYSEIVRGLTPRGVLIYAHVGAFHRVPDLGEQVSAGLGVITRRTSALTSTTEALRWAEDATEDDVGLILELEQVLSDGDEEGELSRLRPAIQTANERGASVLVTSSSPPLSFPSLAGSSILADATHVRVQPLTDERAREWILSRGEVSDDVVANLISHANGSRRLLDEFHRIDLDPDLSGNGKTRAAAAAESLVARETFDELGQELASELSFWVHDCCIFEPHESDISELTVLQALKNAGVLRTASNATVSLLPFDKRDTWLAALGLVIDSQFIPSADWVYLIRRYYEFERRLRFDLRVHFEEHQGADWASEVLSDYARSILELARLDGHPRATSIRQLRSPLDWLTLGTLLGLAESAAGAGTFLGCHAQEWHRIGADLTGVRNRLAHMRQVRTGDASLVKRKLQLLDMRREISMKASPGGDGRV